MSGAPTATPTRVLRFDDGRFVPEVTPSGGPLVADSWLVIDGGVVGWSMHVERFCAAVTRQGGDPDVAARAAEQVPAAIPGAGHWFPRLDWVRDTHREGPVLHVRAAPPLGRRARIRTATRDPRTTPSVKGPDLTALGVLREEARTHGADEAAILAGATVVDGATSAILWWRGDALHLPSAAHPRVASVTAHQVRTLAVARGIRVVEENATPASLAGCEVWIVNALHGIRGVTAWAEADGTHHPIAAPDRADAWHAALEGLRRLWI